MAKVYEGDSPCKWCKEREVGCHAKCVAYKEWVKSGIEVKNDFYDIKKKRRKR